MAATPASLLLPNEPAPEAGFVFSGDPRARTGHEEGAPQGPFEAIGESRAQRTTAICSRLPPL